MMEALEELGDYIAAAFPEAVGETNVSLGELGVHVQRGAIVRVLTFLRDDANCQFKCLMDVCGVDYPERDERFEVVYNLLSLKHNLRVRVKLSTDEETPVPSVTGVFVNTPADTSVQSRVSRYVLLAPANTPLSTSCSRPVM